MYEIKNGAAALHSYPQRGDVPASFGWGDWDALWKRVGERVTFESADAAQAWIVAHRVFAGAAVVVEAT